MKIRNQRPTENPAKCQEKGDGDGALGHRHLGVVLVLVLVVLGVHGGGSLILNLPWSMVASTCTCIRTISSLGTVRRYTRIGIMCFAHRGEWVLVAGDAAVIVADEPHGEGTPARGTCEHEHEHVCWRVGVLACSWYAESVLLARTLKRVHITTYISSVLVQ